MRQDFPDDENKSGNEGLAWQPPSASSHPHYSEEKVPTTAPLDTSIFSSPTMSLEQKAACEAAANGEVYSTSHSVIVRFIYELLFPSDRIATDVASNVDQKVQRFLSDELIECTGPNPLSLGVGGVGPGQDFNAIMKDSCTNLRPNGSQECHLMAGSITLYLQSRGESNSDDEPWDPVSEKLRLAFNGARRSLQNRFVNEELGILQLYYVGAYVYEDKSVNTSGSQGGTSNDIAGSHAAPSYSNLSKKSFLALIPVVVVTSAMILVFAALFLVRRRLKSNELSAKGVQLFDDDVDSASNDSQNDYGWKESSLRISVVDTADETDSTTSWGPVVAAHERVMETHTGLIVDQSSDSRYSRRPVFIDPNSVTFYSRSKSRLSFEKEHSVTDVVEI